MERRIAALLLGSVGVSVNWGAGWGLIVAAVGLAVSGGDLPDWRPALVRARDRVRVLVAVMPRRTAAVMLMAVGVGALVAAGVAFLGAGGGFAGLAVSGIGTGAALGRE